MPVDRDDARGDEYHHPDGTVEVVFEIEGDRLLTVREYDHSQFPDAVQEATYQGVNDDVAELPPAEFYREQSHPTDGTDSGP